MKRRTLAVGLAAALALSSVTSVSPAGGVAGFGDVFPATYYTDAVQWMVDENITTGTSPSCFSPNATVTRGQAAAFLWRMEGSPKPVGGHNFTDVVAEWQQEPVAWMVANGITNGTTATTYSPSDPLTRAQVAVLLHRLAGTPSALPPDRFTDVVAGWQISAIGWMLEQGITTGTSATTFSPEQPITRGQFATFLYRYRGAPAVRIDADSSGCKSFDSLTELRTITDFSTLRAVGARRWRSSVPGIEDVRIASTVDDAEQAAFWLPPQREGKRPLLVILHSWSAGYTQHAGIPFAIWAKDNGWAVIAPDFRGANDNPDALGSDLAVQDAVDAIDYAIAQGGVDADRVYVVGYSGGGMMALLLAGRHPDKVDAVSAWGPPHDLIDFFEFSAPFGRAYATHIAAACGGNPTVPGPAQDECERRSPATYLETARQHAVPIFIAQGIDDPWVHPSGAADVFNILADPADRFTSDQIAQFGNSAVPTDLPVWSGVETFFTPGDPSPVYARQSAAVRLVYFDAGHDMIYNAAARWFGSDPGRSRTTVRTKDIGGSHRH